MKKPINTIENRTRDLPAFSAMPQPTAPPCTTPHPPEAVLNQSKLDDIVTIIHMCSVAVLCLSTALGFPKLFPFTEGS